MARIRTIKPDFFRHVGLYRAEIESKLPLRVSFAGLWTACDREGRFKWEPEILKLDCLPHDKLDFSRVLDALWSRGFIEKYSENDKHYGFVPSFLEHQVINNRESASVLPTPTESNISTRDGRVPDAPQPCTSGREGKGREGKEFYRVIKHLSLSIEQFEKLISEGYSKQQVDDKLDAVENYRDNKKYNDLNLTIRQWFKRDGENPKQGRLLK